MSIALGVTVFLTVSRDFDRESDADEIAAFTSQAQK